MTGHDSQLQELRKRKREQEEEELEELAAAVTAVGAANAAALAELQAEDEEDAQEAGQQEAAGGQNAGQGAAAAGDPGDDSGDNDSNSSNNSDDDGDDSGHGSNTVEQQEEDPTQERWMRTKMTRDSGDSFFHKELMKILQRAYGRRQAGVEYVCYRYHYSTERYAERWEVRCRVRVADGKLRGARELSKHWCAAPREDLAAAIQDAARQAFLEYNGKHYHLLENRRERYYPRRIPGEQGCIIASTLHQRSTVMDATVNLNAVTHTELDHALEDIRALYEENARLRRICDAQRAQLGGPVTLNGHLDTSKAPKRPRLPYGSREARTRMDL